MGNYFFTFESGIPKGMGFAWYGLGHIIWLAGIAVATVFLAIWYRACEGKEKITFDRVVASVMLVLEGLWLGMLASGGNLNLYMLPLHMCSLSIYLYIIYGYHRVSWIGEYIYAFGIPGGLAALLFPNWSAYPMGNYYCISSFLLHGLLVAYGVMLLAGRVVRPNIRNLWKPMAFVLLLAIPLYFFNLHFGSNYMFLNKPSPGSPLELLARFGKVGYLAAYFALVLLVEMVLYLPWWLVNRKRKGSR